MNETIVARATPPGEGGIGILRLSGPRSKEILDEFFVAESSSWGEPQKLCYGYFQEKKSGKRLDDGYAVAFKGPKSYTGEDSAEVYVHGSPIVLDLLVAEALEGGARLADPGEFTRRAFLNGRIDLVQAEAVAEVISSRSKAELELARKRLDGGLSRILENLSENLKSILAECEADIDFPDENLPLEDRPAVLEKIDRLHGEINELLLGYEATKRLHGGFLVALVGPPNAGKSSLFNRLLMNEAAIVTDIPGTTRDLLREELLLDGRRVKLMDTAGLRGETQDEIEKMGMERTHQAVSDADLVLFLLDSSESAQENERRALETWSREKETWLIHTKIDRGPEADLEVSSQKTPKAGQEFSLSSQSGEGLASLREALTEEARKGTRLAEKGVASERQRVRLLALKENLERALKNWKSESPELAARDLHEGYQNICLVLGRDADVEDILDEIFSQFCIGK